MLEGLKVQVRSPHVERINQHFLQEAHNRGVVHLAGALVLLVGAYFFGRYVVELDVVADDFVHRLADAGGLAIDQLVELVVLRDHPVHTQLRGELDALSDRLVRRVGRGHQQPVATLAEGHDAKFGGQLVVDESFGQARGVHRTEIQQWSAVGARHDVRQIERRNRSGTGQFRDETLAIGLGALISGQGVLLADFPGIDQGAAQAGQGDGRFRSGGRVGRDHGGLI